MRHPLASATVLLAVVVLSAPLASSYSPAPPLGGTGAPGELSDVQCIKCHADYPLNAGAALGGAFTVSTPSDSFVTSGTYTLALTISQPVQRRWGFEVVAVAAGGENAGGFGALDATVGIQRDYSSSVGYVYAYHILAGTFAGQPSATWNVSWLAPTDPAITHVTFYASGVAADGVGDSEPQGDYVYQSTWSVQQATTPAKPTTWGRLKALYLSSDAPKPAWTRPLRATSCPAYPASHARG